MFITLSCKKPLLYLNIPGALKFKNRVLHIKKILLLLTVKSLVLLGITFQSGYSIDYEEDKLSNLPRELVTHILKFCPKTNYNGLSMVCKKFLDSIRESTEHCRFKKQCRRREDFHQELLEHYNRLTSLNLSDNELITNEGIVGFTKLTNLNLGSDNNITDECLKGLPKLSVVIGRKQVPK